MKEGKILVISLGGSRIVPDEVDIAFLRKFKEIITKNKDHNKFVIVCGGGSVARKYIEALRANGSSVFLQSMAGISITRVNARFMSYFFGKDAAEGIPHDLKHVFNLLKRNDIVFCGALRYKPNNTSDGTAASLAAYFKAPFINITNVRGLFTDNPKTNKNARFIKETSWKDFNDRAKKIKFKAGQHFVLDQNAANIIMKNKIPTYIIGSLSDLQNIINEKDFEGSIIRD
jgi:uridylate kinase